MKFLLLILALGPSVRASHLMDIIPPLIKAAYATYPERRQSHDFPRMEGVSLLPVIRDNHRKLATENNFSPTNWEFYHLTTPHQDEVDMLPEKRLTWTERATAIPFPEDRQRNVSTGNKFLKSGPMTLTASHCFANDSLEGVMSVHAPDGSGDKSQPKHTFWPHKGTEEMMVLEFGENRMVHGASVYWFDDTGRGGCRTPESWSLEYFDGNAWHPVRTTDAYETSRDVFNTLTFDMVKASALRMMVKLRPDFSGRVLRWLPVFANSMSGVNSNSSPPNIVHIIADDLGWGDAGFHGSEISTPHLDRLAGESVVLDRFYVTPICSPTRAGVLTGRYPWRFGIWGGVCSPTSRHGLPPSETTVPEVLAGAGYRQRALLGKWHLGLASDIFHPLNHGFTDFYGHYNGAVDYFSRERSGQPDWHRDREAVQEDGYSTDLLGKAASRFIHETEGPFYLLVAFNAPHSPLQAKPDDLAAAGFDPSGPRAPNTDAGIAAREQDPDYGEAGKGNDERQTFDAMTRAMDRNIGRILEALDATGQSENTLVVFHSDNGADPRHGGSNKPLRGTKFTTWEGGTRVVAMMRWPAGFKGGRIFTSPASYIDLLPTFAAAANTSIPDGVDGVNLLPVIAGDDSHSDRVLLLGKDTVVSGRWKLKEDELFDLEADPGETINISARHPEHVIRLRGELAKFPAMQGPRFTTKLPKPTQWPPVNWQLPTEP